MKTLKRIGIKSVEIRAEMNQDMDLLYNINVYFDSLDEDGIPIKELIDRNPDMKGSLANVEIEESSEMFDICKDIISKLENVILAQEVEQKPKDSDTKDKPNKLINPGRSAIG